ncbi:unnamed protein product, partial [Ixodes hexagonus]
MSIMNRDKKVKRSKAQNDVPNSGSASNLNMDYFLLEEVEAKARDSTEDEALFKRTTAEIQKNLKILFDMKLQKRPQADIEDLRVHTSFLFLMLKKLNRLDKHRLKVARDAVNEKKQKVDNFHLQLQNLTYEVMHLQKEVTKCMEFRSRDEEIDLVPVEEFYREAPPQVSRRAETDADPHQLTLARLQWELEQRKQLSKKLKGMESMKQSYQKEIEKKKECIDNIQPTLHSILEATHPLHAELGLPLQTHQLEHAHAEYLPRPLYVLYVQTSAYREAYGKSFDVSIEGNVEESKALLAPVEEKPGKSFGESDPEESTKGKRHRRTTRGGSTSNTAKLLHKHPLSVVLEMQLKGYTLQMTFAYVIPLHIVTVVAKVMEPHGTSCGVSAGPALSPPSVLDNLLGADSGTSSPNPANHFQLKKNGLEDFSTVVCEVGKPYRWAQRLSGLKFLETAGASGSSGAPVASHEVGRAFVEQVATAVRLRFSARVALYEQLLSLEKGIVTVPPSMVDHFPTKVTSALKLWTQVSREEVEGHPSYCMMEELGLVTGDELAYQAILRRGSAMLKAFVLLGYNYPSEAPLFLLTLQLREERSSRDDDSVKELERELNVHCVERVGAEQREHLLSYQLQQLLVAMDVLLESQSSSDGLDCPREFSNDTVLARIVRSAS